MELGLALRLGYAALWTFERLLRPIAKVLLWTGDEPAMMPEFYGSTYEPLETLSYVAAAVRRAGRIADGLLPLTSAGLGVLAD
jgi:hypothetical protein